jgi:hypothetical protein
MKFYVQSGSWLLNDFNSQTLYYDLHELKTISIMSRIVLVIILDSLSPNLTAYFDTFFCYILLSVLLSEEFGYITPHLKHEMSQIVYICATTLAICFL